MDWSERILTQKENKRNTNTSELQSIDNELNECT